MIVRCMSSEAFYVTFALLFSILGMGLQSGLKSVFFYFFIVRVVWLVGSAARIKGTREACAGWYMCASVFVDIVVCGEKSDCNRDQLIWRLETQKPCPF